MINKIVYCDTSMASNTTDHTGKRYGRLVALRIIGYYAILDKQGKEKRRRVWECACDCGNTVEVIGNRLTSGNNQSCGCLKSDLLKLFNKQTKRKGIGDSCKHQRYLQYKTRARDRGLLFEFTEEQFVRLCETNCYYCGDAPKTKKTLGSYSEWTSNGIDRIDSSLGYTLDNCVPCCWDCNKIKSAMHRDLFLDKCKKIAARFS